MKWSSDEIDQIAPAFLEAQKASKGAKKDQKNPHLKNMYADFASVVDACKDSLHDNNIAYTQLLGNKDGRNTIKTILLHKSGQWIGDEAFLPEIDQKGINTAQAAGSSISYMKRYGLQSTSGTISEDDDGNAAGQASGQSASEPKKDEPKKDVAYWKALADKNTAHIINLKNWYKKHEGEIKKLPVKDQDTIILYVKALGEKLEKELADKKATEQAGSKQPDPDPGTSEAEAIAKDAQRGSGEAPTEQPGDGQPPEETSDIEPF